MRCNKARKFLNLQMDGVLPPDSTVELTEHLDSCADCREFHEDLLLGRRAILATTPELPDNFEWKLQLRLNQALKETAGEVAYPWQEPVTGRWHWLRNFGSAAAVGMAAVLALAIFFGPVGHDTVSPTPGRTFPSLGSDRLPLAQQFNFGRGFGREVSSGSSLMSRGNSSLQLEPGWSGQNLRDLQTIQSLRDKNLQLNRLLYQAQRQNLWMRSQLDSSRTRALDLEKD